MSKVKSKKKSTFIDMTAMSDVTVLLLTFFMTTSTFIPKEPVQVITPNSVSEIKVPESNIMTILIDPKGRVFLNLDRPSDKIKVLEKIGEDYNIKFTPKQIQSFVNQANIGMPAGLLPKFLDMPSDEQFAAMKDFGIPADSTNNQFKRWVMHAREVNPDLKIAIKADKTTAYPKIKHVMNTLLDLKENRYSLVTTLEGMPEGM